MAASAELQQRAAKMLTEFLGTMFLCLTVAMTGRSAIAPVAIGCVLMVCVYAGGHVSGGHYNPAVTLAVLVRGGGKLRAADAALYLLSQLSGALCAVLLSWALLGGHASAAAYPSVAPGLGPLAACLCESVVTFALCSVVLHTATTEAQAGNSHFGLAIGFTVLSGAVAVGGSSGGAFNPAVGSTALLQGGGAGASDVWIYWVAPLVGGVAAGVVFRAVAWKEFANNTSPVWEMLAPCFVELIGTMMLSFAVGTAGGPLAPLAIGSMLMVMIYMGGWISGGHYNPAVTLAVLVRSLLGAKSNRCTLPQALRYAVAQLFGAALGTLLALGAERAASCPMLPASSSIVQGLVGELLGTFLLAYMVLNVATVERVAGNSYYGLAIGMVVTSMACAIGPVSGGAFNPAVGTMGLFLGKGVANLWIYWVACPLGAVLAAGCFRLQNFQDFEATGQEDKASNGEFAASEIAEQAEEKHVEAKPTNDGLGAGQSGKPVEEKHMEIAETDIEVEV